MVRVASPITESLPNAEVLYTVDVRGCEGS